MLCSYLIRFELYCKVFCYDVERYILGKQNVYGKNIRGKNVPNVVYYTTIHDSKIWFETNSASTISAYANPKENENERLSVSP